jgi:hypothetical protein
MTVPPRITGCLGRFYRADEAGAELIDIQLRRPTLGDLFIDLTGRPWSQTTDEVRQ